MKKLLGAVALLGAIVAAEVTEDKCPCNKPNPPTKEITEVVAVPVVAEAPAK